MTSWKLFLQQEKKTRSAMGQHEHKTELPQDEEEE